MYIRPYIPLSVNELIFGLLLLFFTTFLVAEVRWSRLHGSTAIEAEDPVHLYLQEKTGLEDLSRVAIDSGLTQSREEFMWAARLLGWRYFREGHYLIDRSMNYDEFLSKLARGLQDPVSLTILPGKGKQEIAASVARVMQFDSLSFHRTLRDSLLLEELGLEEEDVIGRLYPNTYSLFWTATPERVFRRILREFENAVVRPHKERFKELDRSVDEIVTLASIIEWEAKNREEQAVISGLYWNRLDRGMRLQADPTVNFAIGERRRLLYEDYRIDHPYNTYQFRGLPPGPITNPSLSAIEAALYPEDHEYLYMVASPDGTHAFSKTFEAHKRKSAQWREWLREQYRIKERKEKQENSK